MRGEYWDANRALLRPRNVYPITLLHPHVTPKPDTVTYVAEEVLVESATNDGASIIDSNK
jgi:hypothetical protein